MGRYGGIGGCGYSHGSTLRSEHGGSHPFGDRGYAGPVEPLLVLPVTDAEGTGSPFPGVRGPPAAGRECCGSLGAINGASARRTRRRAVGCGLGRGMARRGEVRVRTPRERHTRKGSGRRSAGLAEVEYVHERLPILKLL
ncbi:hypothetical protein AvCA_51140 [Azotobacter vinelandii CA]|uniref:Uncharacterized protein n=2 Tax=Azotobacter vinelandii TaxID=354 RepID=C1DMC2_AZOVD|nr:hypothetical protein Avin_51140 [Azotobacter vinelandii DJ]AGK14139.1 hypothetical protein AvCA_51140 [Azotobacter vinelandii CA]AGK22398.1 hypothetical protein AvCA6_51140 [Azotobacter vinelandii CA6]